MRRIIGISTTILLSACTTTQQANTALSTKFAGKSADSFFMQYGPPASSYTMNDGRRMYVWAETQRNFQLPGSSTSTVNVIGNTAYVNTTTTPGANIAMQCQVRLVVSQAGTIEQIQAQSDSMGVWQTSRCNEVFGS
ncbi:hypothetical protein RFM41_13190 [Mesorhizobium sp. VK25A]|uniref:Uncharacterized protein n=1 Tax=Mesorhizobium vachelliae TaxID=3072309 RepID=A0ABU5A6J0_9HYPH|nr:MULTISPECIES: hypothetical protein [unclassified Mesorhizobium]MDX8532795.1 hypothetical protein [Mesorhizobium sp. VK25D]MDX8544699.1 hypothetical protein [Mesorhizobium sp. VK25A]